MSFDFPASPADGQKFTPSGGPTYIWSSATTAWKIQGSIGAPGNLSISDTPPPAPQVGQMWWESDTGNLFAYVNDGDSSQWVQINVPNATLQPTNYALLAEQAAAPATGANQGALYTKDVGGITDLFYRRDTSGLEIPLSPAWQTTGVQTLPTTVAVVTVMLFPGVSMIDVVIDLVSGVAAFTPYIQLGNSGGAFPAGNYYGTQSALGASTVTSGLWANNIAQFAGVGHLVNASIAGIAQIRGAGQRFLYQATSSQIATPTIYLNQGLLTNPGTTCDRVVIGVTGGNFDSGNYQVYYR